MDYVRRELAVAFSRLIQEEDVREKAFKDDELFAKLVRVAVDNYGVTEKALMPLLNRHAPHFIEGWRDGVALPNSEGRSLVLWSMARIIDEITNQPEAT